MLAGEILQFGVINAKRFETFSNLCIKLGALVENLGAKGVDGSHEMSADTAV